MRYETRTGVQMSTRKSHNTYDCDIEKFFDGELAVYYRMQCTTECSVLADCIL